MDLTDKGICVNWINNSLLLLLSWKTVTARMENLFVWNNRRVS